MKLRTRLSRFGLTGMLLLTGVILTAVLGNLWPSSFQLSNAWADDVSTSSDALAAAVVAQQHEIAALIEQLGNPQYADRRRAERQLIQFGFEAFDALKDAEDHDDLEIATRARYLVQLISVELMRPHDPPKVRSLLTRYKNSSALHRLGVIERLARMPDDIGLEGLCRIVRYEKSQKFSKRAAFTIIAVHATVNEAIARREKTMRTALGRSVRPGAQWLFAYLQTLHDPSSRHAQWQRLVRIEQTSVGESSSESHDDLLASLLYTIGGLHLDLGDHEAAEKYSQQAFHIAEGAVAHHSRMASFFLIGHGRFAWAEREYRSILDLVHPDSTEARNASLRLAGMFHDQLQDLDAATVLQETMEKRSPRRRISQSTLAHMEYLFAEHNARQDDRAKQREHLDKAVALDPTNADVLIAMYRLPDVDEAYRAKTVHLIQAAAATFDKGIKASPNTTAWNQWAWLICNTEGDFKKAIKFSHRSVETVSKLAMHSQIEIPYTAADEAGYLDTLGHCYYAQGEYENAVKYQQQAAYLMPHSKIIGRQLDVFKTALADAQR